jgi:Fe2+ transport system protein FeoA
MESVPSANTQAALSIGHRNLDGIAVGAAAVVGAVPADVAAELAREGLVPGALVRVAGRVAGGGPVIVSLGRARLALGRSICRSIEVTEP